MDVATPDVLERLAFIPPRRNAPQPSEQLSEVFGRMALRGDAG